jgi:hypothetical protein
MHNITIEDNPYYLIVSEISAVKDRIWISGTSSFKFQSFV